MFGSDAHVGTKDGHFDYVAIVEFDSADDDVVYRDHPGRQGIMATAQLERKD